MLRASLDGSPAPACQCQRVHARGFALTDHPTIVTPGQKAQAARREWREGRFVQAFGRFHHVVKDELVRPEGAPRAAQAFDGIGFGLGWSVIVDPIKARLLASKGEFGWGGWASTFFAVVPREQMIVLSFAQIAPSDRYPIRRQLRTMAMSTIVD